MCTLLLHFQHCDLLVVPRCVKFENAFSLDSKLNFLESGGGGGAGTKIFSRLCCLRSSLVYFIRRSFGHLLSGRMFLHTVNSYGLFCFQFGAEMGSVHFCALHTVVFYYAVPSRMFKILTVEALSDVAVRFIFVPYSLQHMLCTLSKSCSG